MIGGPAPTGPHVMAAEQRARRREWFAGAIGVPGCVQVGRYRYAAAYEGLRLRAHAGCVEISFLARGHQIYRVNRRLYRLRGGDQYVVFPDELHDSGGMPEEKGILYWMVFRVDPPGRPWLFLDRAASRTLRAALLSLPRRHFAAEPGTEELLERLCAVLGRGRGGLARIEAAELMLRYLLATLRAARADRRRTPSPRIRRSLDQVAAAAGELPRASQLARIAGLSPARFHVRFRAEVGLPPREYVLRQRVEFAQARLRLSAVPVTELAHQLGFSSSQYFATVFRRFCGVTPTAYRAAVRSDDEISAG